MKVLARLSIFGMIVAAAAIVPISQPVHAEVVLLSGDDPLSGSDTAIIVGGTFESTPTTSFAQAAENLYLNPLGFDGGATDSTVCDMIATDPCSAPLQVLTTPELLQQGPSSLTGASDVVLAVENEFRADPDAFNAEHPLTVFGYSQSATAESIAMTQLAEAGIPSDDLRFVFIGDPSREGGVADEHEAEISTRDAGFRELSHCDRFCRCALRVSEHCQRMFGVESVWIRSEFVLHGENDVRRAREGTRALL